MNFKDLGLDPNILRAIDELGFVAPTEIQEHAIPNLLSSGTDLVALAQTGTGKTAAFGLPLVQLVDANNKDTQALVLSPTRELAIQIMNDLQSFSKYMKGIRVEAVYGGASITNQMRSLNKGCQIVVGTPGRTLDLVKRRALDLSNIQWLVLDEADEMLNMGFQEDLDAILSQASDEKQTLLFSATMPKEIARIAQNYMHNANEITVGTKNSGAKDVSHEYYMVNARDRYEALKRIADMNPDIYGIVFCRTRRETKEVAGKLMEDGYNADALYGDLSQAQRDEVMQRFRKKQIQLLVATDVAARGIDVDDLTHVINYELPDDLEVYIHRSGRTGRAGKSGISIAIVHTREMRKIDRLEQMSGKKFEKKMVPGGEEILEMKLTALAHKLKAFQPDKQDNRFLESIKGQLDGLDQDDLVKYIIHKEFDRFLKYNDSTRDINAEPGKHKGDDKGGRDSSGTEWTEIFISVGKNHFINPANLMGLVNDETGDKSIKFGRIDVRPGFTTFEVEAGASAKIIDAMQGLYYEDTPITVRLGDGGKGKKRGGRSGGFKGGKKGGGNFRSGGGNRGPKASSGGHKRSGNRGGGGYSGGGRSGGGGYKKSRQR